MDVYNLKFILPLFPIFNLNNSNGKGLNYLASIRQHGIGECEVIMIGK